MADFNQDQINYVWGKAIIIQNYDKNTFRQDFSGAWIQKDKYGIEVNFGWEIDHIFPKSLGGQEEYQNLQPLQWENNRTKGDNFPKFSTSVSSEGNNFLKVDRHWEIKDDLLTSLKKLYPKNNNL